MTPRIIDQQNSDTEDRFRVVTSWFHVQDISVLKYPSLSPDLHPIEHRWDILDGRIRTHIKINT